MPHTPFLQEGAAIEKWDRVTGVILLVIGAVGAWSSAQLKMGSFRHPGVGFLPFGLCIILIGLSLALIISRWKKGTSVPFWSHRTWLKPLLGIVILGLYALVIETLGFPLTTFAFLLAWMGVIERIHWLKMLMISVGVTIVLYLIFGYFLEVPVPMGFFK
jgi:putative tricarboxylic transport membrane protein